MKGISDLLWTDPDDLLDDGAALLNEDFERLGQSSATNKELWVASMEAALIAADHLKRAKRKHGEMRNDKEVGQAPISQQWLKPILHHSIIQ